MHQQRTQHTIDVPARAFADRVGALSAAQSPTGSVYSRLALIHQVAKAYAVEAVVAAGYVPTDQPGDEQTMLDRIDIDELTDPPLYEGVVDPEDRVVIHFSY
ncbi:hypothetical protein FAES_4705 [Fibrella aestuarina BUZ 2]|uniref:Uncharacterized protein n=1 Tax=Fibrella aestuarina BUZ 2 TaxID=1166018 RepID=I0KF01_9BACT|nr:hypothetical protein [Fibrella aestuarina]CCH02704.1 hypothetical protein FAES_4705 [Fibrella aestuarina BUZ 2]